MGTNVSHTLTEPPAAGHHFLEELQWRGQLHQCSDLERLRSHLSTARRKAYIGLDPTADSLTIGNLVVLMLLSRFAQAGHEPMVLAGGGTGLIGDPGGKDAERPLLPIDQIAANVQSQRRIYDALLPEAIVMNNADWLTTLSYVAVLRDVGKHFSVNEMIKRDSIRNRLEGDGISYTEFSYMLLQAYDFHYLHAHHDVTLQMGGSDQWGNIVSGVDLIRRNGGGEAYALTTPLLTKTDGGKFGKSESGAVWLTADRTSPYAFHQFWMNADDADIPRFLRTFTFMTVDQITELERELLANPGARVAHRCLADEITTRLHGQHACERANSAARALFSGDVAVLDAQTLSEVFADVASANFDARRLSGEGMDLVEVLVTGQLAKSNREAREFLQNNSITVNGERVGPDRRLTNDDLLHGTTVLLRRGKKHWLVTAWS